MDQRNPAGKLRHSKNHSHWFLKREETALCSQGVFAFKVFFFPTTQLVSEETASCFSCLLTPLTSILFSAVFEQQARQEGHVDRLRDPRQGVDLHGLLLVVCSTRESF